MSPRLLRLKPALIPGGAYRRGQPDAAAAATSDQRRYILGQGSSSVSIDPEALVRNSMSISQTLPNQYHSVLARFNQSAMTTASPGRYGSWMINAKPLAART